MKRKMYTEEQIAYAPRQTEAGTPTRGATFTFVDLPRRPRRFEQTCKCERGTHACSTPVPQRIGIYSRTCPHSPRPHIGSRSLRRSEHQ